MWPKARCRPFLLDDLTFDDITVVNLSRATDSKHSLDAESQRDNSGTMIAQPYYLYAERIDAAKNMTRFYALSIQPTLFGQASLL